MDTFTMDRMIIPVWEWSNALNLIAHKFPYRYKDFAQSISRHHWQHKSNLVEQISMINTHESPVVYVLGSWYGAVLVPLLMHHMPDIKKLYLFDYDSEALEICYTLHERYNHVISRQFADVNFEIDKLKSYEEQPNIVINTSCESMWKMKDLLLGANVVHALQGNNFPEASHINLISSMDIFKQQSGLTNIMYEDERPYDENTKHTMYTLIGINHE